MTTAYTSPETNPRPARMIVPDVARGLALLGIAIANVPTVWLLSNTGALTDFFGGVTDDSLADQIAVVITAIAAHQRGLPMFSTLLGFGIGLIVLSLWRRSFPPQRARRVLLRRYGLLAIFGVLHGVLLFFGDIMAFYGLAGLLIATMFTLRDKALLIIARILLGITVVLGVGSGFAGYFEPAIMGYVSVPEIEALSYPSYLLTNLVLTASQLAATPFLLLMLFAPMLIGFVWARSGVLADVDAHRRQLITWTVLGVVIAFGVGLPWGLSSIGVLPENIGVAFMMANQFLGALTGPAILAGLALLLNGVQKRINHAQQAGSAAEIPLYLRIPAALGKRSMSGYIMQSILLVILVMPFTLDLGHGLGAAGKLLLAVGVWAVTLVLAWILELMDKQGPFEWVHRRLSYGRTGRPEIPSTSSM